MAATHRAVYQVLEHGHIFSDPLAVAILGVDEDDNERRVLETPSSRRMRLFISLRSRFAQDTLATAWQNGVRQLLVLGGGLDTLSYRRELPSGLRVFEADRAETLAGEGFNRNERTFVTWLGVAPYLTEDAIWTTLKFIAALPGGADVVFDYSNPPHTLSPERHRPDAVSVPDAHSPVAANVHSLSHFDTADLHEQLHQIGFIRVNDLGPVEIAQRYLPDVTAHVAGTGGHIVHIATA
jgi:O-methyltransferase involved in polyketide biosynthesis